MPYYPEKKQNRTEEKPGLTDKRPRFTGKGFGLTDGKPELTEKEKEQTKTEKKRKVLFLGVMAVFCLMILYGGVRLALYIADLNGSRNTSRELQQLNELVADGPELDGLESDSQQQDRLRQAGLEQNSSVSGTDGHLNGVEIHHEGELHDDVYDDVLHPVHYSDNPDLRISERFLKLRRKGEYIIGWLGLDQVEEAVVQKDNTFFLTHDALGKKNDNGAVFLDEHISLGTRPYTLILYGHNMKSGNMFGRLRRYEENEYFYKHQMITFDSMFEDGQYAVFAVMEMSTVPGTARWYDLWSLATDSRAARKEAIQKLENRSVVSSVLDVAADDQLLLLVTCVDEETDRLVVAARRLREGEKQDHLTIR